MHAGPYPSSFSQQLVSTSWMNSDPVNIATAWWVYRSYKSTNLDSYKCTDANVGSTAETQLSTLHTLATYSGSYNGPCPFLSGESFTSYSCVWDCSRVELSRGEWRRSGRVEYYEKVLLCDLSPRKICFEYLFTLWRWETLFVGQIDWFKVCCV